MPPAYGRIHDEESFWLDGGPVNLAWAGYARNWCLDHDGYRIELTAAKYSWCILVYEGTEEPAAQFEEAGFGPVAIPLRVALLAEFAFSLHQAFRFQKAD